MKTPKFTTALLAGAALFASTTFAATTDPVGYTTISIPSGSVGSPSLTLMSLPLQASADIQGASSGTITSATSNSVTVTSAAWAAGDLSLSSAPYFLKIKSGALSGSFFEITANSNDTLTLDNLSVDLSILNSSADAFEIIPGDTLLSVFGTSAESVVGGTGSSDADLIYVLDGTWTRYYFNNSNNRWEVVGLPFLGNQDDVVLRPDSSIIYARVGPEFDIVTTGTVPTNQIQVPNAGDGVTAVATVIPVDTTLGELGLQDMPNWRAVGDAGVTSSNADLVYVFDGTWTRAYYDRSLSQWLVPGLSFLGDQSSKTIPSGGGYLLARFGASSTDVFTLTTPY